MKTLKQLTCLIGLLILSGCGFELQNTGNLNEKIDSVYIQTLDTPMEYELAYQVVWSLFKGNQEIISDTKHIETQDYSFDQNQLLGKRKEAEYLNDSLAAKISKGVLLKLGSI